MYITNRPDVAEIAQRHGVDRVFIDMEYIGKSLRQGGCDTVQNHHTVADVRAVRAVLHSSELLVRVNPIHDALADACSSEEEIEAVIAAGADLVMLPYFKTADEVRRFLNAVNGRAKTMLLLESKEAVERFDEIMALPGIDEVHIGLNDLSLSYGKPFLFDLLADGTVERLCLRLKLCGIPYGFGGIASLGSGMVPAERIIREHYRLGSQGVILSRSFCNTERMPDPAAIEAVFADGVPKIRALERECAERLQYFEENRRALTDAIRLVSERIRESNP